LYEEKETDLVHSLDTGSETTATAN